jgi:hypothetical protein
MIGAGRLVQGICYDVARERMDGDLLAEPGMEIDLTLTIHQDHVALAGSHEAQAKVESENDVALTIPNIDSTPSRPQSYWGLQIMRRVGAARCVEEKDGSRTGTRLLVRQRAAPWHKKLIYATRLGADRQTGSAVFGLHCKLLTAIPVLHHYQLCPSN